MIIENQEKRQAGIVVITGISGSGKTTLSKIFDDEHTLISYTTRAPRPGEVDGVDYYFLSEAQATELSESNSVLRKQNSKKTFTVLRKMRLSRKLIISPITLY